MKKIVFATNNKNKLAEIRAALDGQFEIVSLEDIGCFDDIPETAPTLEGNALQKARYIHERYATDVFSDDTGLEVACLNGEPGVYSARYAGPQKNANDNMDLLLEKMRGSDDRSAEFKTCIALIINNVEHTFVGTVEGQITSEKSGAKGFGYDPIFLPNGYDRTFAEMEMDEKNQISHRARAFRKMIDFLQGQF